ncbi:hypothetical protein Agub_g10535, partial [Astrephomene gubernaculifera]
MMAPGDGSTLVTVRDALAQMATAIRSGNIQEARGIGDRCVVPLSVTAMELGMSGKLSEGSESTVYRGTWRGRQVAVKKVRISTSADLDRFRCEVALLAELGGHPAVLPLLAARALPPDYLMVLPLAPGGTVRQALYDRGWRPSWRQLLGLAHRIAAGMEHLHAAGVLHRDIKPANLLLLENPPTAGRQQQSRQQSQQDPPPLSPEQQQQQLQQAGQQQPHPSGPQPMEVEGSGQPGEQEEQQEQEQGDRMALPAGMDPVRVQIADFG